MKVIVLYSLVTFCALIGLGYGAAGKVLGECPDGHRPGDRWYPAGCQMCRCHDRSYDCFSCGTYSLDYDRSRCYEYRDMEQQYPDCCQPMIRCRGEPGFDDTLLTG